MARINYLNNKDLLLEITKSKNTYSEFLSPEYEFYDAVVCDLNEITEEFIEEVKEKKATLLFNNEKQRLKELGLKKELKELERQDPSTIPTESLVFRYMTHDHIPENLERVKKKKTVADYKEKVNFPPFKHLILKNGEFEEVGRSHWIGGFHNGHFSTDHGRMTNKHAHMIKLLVEKYSQKGNWRGYTYNDEMQARAMLQLCTVGLQFNESKSDNPFAYYTCIATNAFTGVLNAEKRSQEIRDDILIMSGVMPSMTRQVENEMEQKQKDFNDEHGIVPSEVVVKRKYGRPKKGEA